MVHGLSKINFLCYKDGKKGMIVGNIKMENVLLWDQI